MNHRRWLIMLAVGIGLGTLIIYGLKPRPALVEISTVLRGPLQVSIVEEARTRVIDRYEISAPVSGYARRMTLEVGDEVSASQSVLWLDPLPSAVLDPRTRAEMQASIAATEAQLQSASEQTQAAEVEVGFRKTNLGRVRKLTTAGTIPRERLDQAETILKKELAALRSARFQQDAARHQLAAARARLRHSVAQETGAPAETVIIRTPVSGRVLKIFHESEGIINAGEILLEIGNPDALEVEVAVLSADAISITTDSRVLLERWGGEQPLNARVRRVEPVAFTEISALGVEEQRVLSILDITSPPEQWRQLGDGYRVEARFILWEGKNILQAPNTALFRHGGGWAVFAVENQTAVLRPVTIEHRGNLATQIVAGIDEGVQIVAHPGEGIEDGDRVSALR
jgi:HlyD family secretion protein